MIPFVLSGLGFWLSSMITENMQTTDYKYVSGYVVSAAYYEDWNELVTRIITETYTDSQGNMRTRTRTVTEVVYHPEYYEAYDSCKQSYSISKASYHSFVKHFGNQQFVNLNRHHYSNDGDKYVTKFPGVDELLVPTCHQEGYTNKTQAANTVFDFPEVDKDIYPVYDYPKKNQLQYPPVLGNATREEQKALEILNSRLGKSNDIRVWVLLYEEESQDIGFQQENYWKGGNQNEIVITLGLSDRKPKWVYVFGWTKSEMLKVETRNYIMNQEKLDLVSLANWLRVQIPKQYEPRDFKEFDYIQVDPPFWATLICFFIVLVFNVLVSWWIVVNEHHDEPGYRPRNWNVFRRFR